MQIGDAQGMGNSQRVEPEDDRPGEGDEDTDGDEGPWDQAGQHNRQGPNLHHMDDGTDQGEHVSRLHPKHHNP
jgi:hypothetical protein